MQGFALKFIQFIAPSERPLMGEHANLSFHFLAAKFLILFERIPEIAWLNQNYEYLCPKASNSVFSKVTNVRV
jgi:hypothetical protein